MPKFDKQSHNTSLSKQRALAENAEIDRLLAAYPSFKSTSCRLFADFPLSAKTLRGLADGSFVTPTRIQQESIPLALKGCDILGAAKTGSGKTLSFVIPALEKIFTKSWTHYDGCGVLIVTPTRELASQIFDVLKVVGKYHTFSAGVVIGGKSLKDESKQIRSTNIIICTPGRLRQHMEETYNFDMNNLQVLVLDEADRMLDMGFKRDMDIIIENLSPERQTLLFSATQTKSLNDLARLSLRNPVFVSAHELSEYSTPNDLRQTYLLCNLNDKLNILFSFIKTHLQQKALVFVSTCKQVKFIYAVFCKLRPGTPIMALHGDMNQMKRIGVYEDFCLKQRGILLATDVAARGLDFPGINWVVQMDCPDSVESYIHRVGRTARFEKGGQALLFLLPSEKAILSLMEKRRIPISGIKTNPKQVWSIDAKLQATCASDISLKERAQRAFVSYVRSVYLMADKSVFQLDDLDFEAYAKSLGLVAAPSITFAQNAKKSSNKKSDVSVTVSTKSKPTNASFSLRGIDDVDEELLVPVGSVDTALVSDGELEIASKDKLKYKTKTKISEAKRSLKKKLQGNKHVVFPENDGDPAAQGDLLPESCREDVPEKSGFQFTSALERMSKADALDKHEWKRKVREDHRRKRLTDKALRREKNKNSNGVTLGNGESESDESGVSQTEAAQVVNSEDEEYGNDFANYFDGERDSIASHEKESCQDAEDDIEDMEEEEAIYNSTPSKRRHISSEDAESLALELLTRK